jgi:aminoglycoside phosphotransferase (APT) family kinase protein
MSIAAAAATYLSRAWGLPVRVDAAARIPGGASRETWRLDATVDGRTRGLILRRDPAGSLIDTDRGQEFAALRSVHGRLPVPEPLLLERDGAELERPFFVMERIDGGQVASPFVRDPYGPHAAALGEQAFRHLGTLAALDPAATPLAAAGLPEPGDCWRVQLDYWAGVIDADEQHPQPIVRAAIRWLRRHPPPPAQRIAIVHGDYRTGNLLHDGGGRLLAVLDWEMAHLGDPLEDLGWATDALWTHGTDTLACGMLPLEEALAVWRRASGLAVDPAAFAWWSLFAAVKGQAIWTSAAREYRDGGYADPVLAISGWYTARRHDEILSRHLCRLEGVA